MAMLCLVYTDNEGRLLVDERLQPAGRTGDTYVEITEEDLIPMPEGATLSSLPGRSPVGVARNGEFRVLPGENRYAVGALMPQGYTRTLLPAYRRGGNKPLPLFGYTAVAMDEAGQLYCAARATDEDADRWAPRHYNKPDLPEIVDRRLAADPDNRVLAHLGRCAREWGCYTAQNVFYRRFEGGIPVSPACNARCLGCISEAHIDDCPAAQERLKFVPTLDEIASIMRTHLSAAPDTIISFGQGCEGDPSMQGELIARAITAARKDVAQGTINANTNLGYTPGARAMIEAGISSLRVSLNSAIPEHYAAYYHPHNYEFEDVERNIKAAVDSGVYVSLNLLSLPGVTDREEELEALFGLIDRTGLQMIQIRNLNIDPDLYLPLFPPAKGELLGLGNMPELVELNLPGVKVGNFSRPVNHCNGEEERSKQ
jgi:pyruvate-formate lyase-activating enzyme